MRGLLLVAMLASACTFEPGQVITGFAFDASTGPHDDAGSSKDALGDGGTASGDAVVCPSSYAAATYMGSGYRLTNLFETWDQAKADCANDSGHLAKIESMGENDFLTKAIPTSSYLWIGLRDVSNNDQYVWTDGTPLGSYNGFLGGTVPTGSYNCIDMSASTGTWFLYDCSRSQQAICECP